MKLYQLPVKISASDKLYGHLDTEQKKEEKEH